MGISVGEEPDPAYVEMTLNRRRPLYTRADRPVVEYTVYDRIGRPIPDFPVRLDVQPRGQEVGPDERLHFLEEGAGAVRGCATPDICGRRFFVDDGPASLEIISPERGVAITGEPQIQVHGRTDVDPNVRVFVNDLPVDIDENGEFRTELRAEFGMNRVDVLADDGVRRPATICTGGSLGTQGDRSRESGSGFIIHSHHAGSSTLFRCRRSTRPTGR